MENKTFTRENYNKIFSWHVTKRLSLLTVQIFNLFLNQWWFQMSVLYPILCNMCTSSVRTYIKCVYIKCVYIKVCTSSMCTSRCRCHHFTLTVLKIAVGHRSFSVQKFVGADIPVNSRPSCPSKMADRLHTI